MIYKGKGTMITTEVFRNLKVGDILSNKWYSDENDGVLGYDYEVLGINNCKVTLQIITGTGSRGGYYTLTEDECINDTELYLKDGVE